MCTTEALCCSAEINMVLQIKKYKKKNIKNISTKNILKYTFFFSRIWTSWLCE